MTIVKELNNLAKKITGDNPKARTDAQAVKYISDNYSGGGSGGNEPLVFNITNAIDAFYDASEADTTYTITSDEASALREIRSALTENPKQFVYLDCGGNEYMLANDLINGTNQLTISAMANDYFQGTASILFVYIKDGQIVVCKREYN